MFESSVVRAKVYPDETGVFYEIPVLLTPAGPLDVLLDYLLEHWDSRSPKWMEGVTSSVRLFLEYLDAHPLREDAQLTFQNFRQRLLTGSVNVETGDDPSGLWWSPLSPNLARRVLRNLTDFFDWWAQKHPGKRNPSEQWAGSAHDRRVAQAAYEYRRNRALLGHSWSTFTESSRRPGSTAGIGKWQRPPKAESPQPLAFPEDRILDLVLKGFKVGGRWNYRDMLITLLLNGAGFRESEPFHLYLWDVTEDPAQPGSALVLIHHPSWGSAPRDPLWKDINGKQRTGSRAQYLGERYGLAPRDWGLSTAAAGWKGGMHESQFGGYYKQAYWFVPEFGRLFWDIWHRYMEQVQRIDPVRRHHPFAFLNVAREPVGAMYKMGKFEDAHAAAVRRIGLVSGKQLGTSIHGHRHAYGQRLRRAGVPPMMIRRFMHHADIESQRVYTEADRAECLTELSRAIGRLNAMTGELRAQIVSHVPASVTDELR